MDILVTLTYYTPHISGLTVYAKRLSERLADKGNAITILTSQYSTALQRKEYINGIKIIRVPVTFRLNKGVFMGSYIRYVLQNLRNKDAVHVHLPSLEASLVAFTARVRGINIITTYHCDLRLPRFPLSFIFNCIVAISHFFTLLLSDTIVAYTQDFAQSSRLLRFFKKKIRIIAPPVIVSNVDKEKLLLWQEKRNLHGVYAIGMATRFAEDKGIEYMLHALSVIIEKYPDIMLLFAGEHKCVVGENRYYNRVKPLLERYKANITFLGVLSQEDMACFYSTIECLVVSSVNSTESFGLVQVEAMMCGTPVVATDLPGVRVPVAMTGMGGIVSIRDSNAIANAVISILANQEQYIRPRDEIENMFSIEKTVDEYESIFGSNLG